ncbi:MAG: DEAD/DEAH box helicase [Kiritimatiellae bacterium]|nr:DEAD/DEAH box helicase [Kiritimatiellia bacterium]
MTTKKSSKLTLRDRLSRLNFLQACKLLGGTGGAMIREGGKIEIELANVNLTDERLAVGVDGATVSMWLSDDRRQRLNWSCSACGEPCVHVGAVFSLILEEKTALGLAVPATEDTPMELLTEEELVQRMLAEREARARTEKMRLKALTPGVLWSDYLVSNRASGKTYRVALRGWERGEAYCSCPDFKTNTLGTCKHVLFALDQVKRRFPADARNTPYRRKNISVHLRYAESPELRILLPAKLPAGIERTVGPLRDRAIGDVHDLLKRVRALEANGHSVHVYPDAEEYIRQQLFLERIRACAAKIREDPASHELRRRLLKAELLPYQLDGIAFAAGAGRAILADDMGLGKTIQGIGVAELLKREVGIGKVLIVCPASVKAQWLSEIKRFSDSSCDIVLGGAAARAKQYGADTFFTICNYEQVMRDILAVENVPWDLIILDEGQRIKNWETKTARVIKGLRSPFALVLSGTPLENRLDDLFSVVEFIDEHRLGPAFHFFHRHREVDERGKVLGYKNLSDLRRRLEPMMLRRTRASVLQQLPPRMTEIVRIEPTAEQADLHVEHMRVVSSIVGKRHLTEMDMLRLQKALLMCRMCANSTFLVTKEPPGYSSKLEKLREMLRSFSDEDGRKVVLFSEWTTMLDLVEPHLENGGKKKYVRLDGTVPQKKRQMLVNEFRKNPDCAFFLTTNAGATGLNLQAANTVVNVDLPWNPAVLEQRIGRAHRMGQKRPVQVFVLITEGTIEETLLNKLAAKSELSLAALDSSSDVDVVELESGMEELRRRLEILIGAKPNAPVDESMKQSEEREAAERRARRERMSIAGGQLVSAAFNFLGELIPQAAPTGESETLATRFREQLQSCMEQDEQGRLKLTVTLPDAETLSSMASSLARLAAFGGQGR